MSWSREGRLDNVVTLRPSTDGIYDINISASFWQACRQRLIGFLLKDERAGPMCSLAHSYRGSLESYVTWRKTFCRLLFSLNPCYVCGFLKDTPPVKELNTPSEFRIFSFVVVSIGIAVSHCMYGHTRNYGGNKIHKIYVLILKFLKIAFKNFNKKQFRESLKD